MFHKLYPYSNLNTNMTRLSKCLAKTLKKTLFGLNLLYCVLELCDIKLFYYGLIFFFALFEKKFKYESLVHKMPNK